MPTITDHLASAREHARRADEEPSHHYRQVVNLLLCSLENLTEAVDLLHQQRNQDFGRLTQLERDCDHHRS